MTTSAGKFAAPTFTVPGWNEVVPLPDVSEDEAQAMLCCGPLGCGQEDVVAEVRLCAAARCMAWRWGRDLIERTQVMQVAPTVPAFGAGLEQYPIRQFGDQLYKHPYPVAVDFRPEGEGWEIEWVPSSANLFYWSRLKARRGYCALAARPENGGAK